MRIAYITAGAAGMFCGSCMHDNTLVAELRSQGHDALLIPTYTPIRTDEIDVSQRRIFFGGINVYLQQKFPFFRRTPWFMDRLLDWRPLLGWVSRYAVKTESSELAELFLSMLRGGQGNQSKEIDKLVLWLRDDVRPEIINLTNVLLSGIVPKLRAALKAPILATLQGDDVFLEGLPEDSRRQALELIRERCQQIDGFVSTSEYYADFMSKYLSIPRERIHVVYPGLNLKGHGTAGPTRNGSPFTIGYFARICPEKGLHCLAEAFCLLKKQSGLPPFRLLASGWLGESQRAYFDYVQKMLTDAGCAGDFQYIEAPDHASKMRFFQSIDVLSVPTTYREPKGIYVLEAWANGVPVVQPGHGAFPELLNATGGGVLVKPEDPQALARELTEMMMNPTRRIELGQKGKLVVQQRFHAAEMARRTVEVYRHYTFSRGP